MRIDERAAKPVGRVTSRLAVALTMAAASLMVVSPALAMNLTARDGGTKSAVRATHVRRGDNPANPSCNHGLGTQFSGGTGAFYSNHFLSSYVNAPFTGAADVPNGRFTNIFLYPHADTMTWDQYQASLGMGAPTQEQVDAMTQALVCSSYFDDLTQYNINPPSYLGDQSTDSTCVTNAVNDAGADSNVISYATMRSFAACNNQHSLIHSDQVNIFVSPDLKASAYGNDGINMCGSGGAVAYHGWGWATTDGAVPNFTVNPTNSGCASDPSALLANLSHEMVELTSDPAGAGWLHFSSANLTQDYDDGELGDICNTQTGLFPTPSVPFPTTPALQSVGLTGNLSVATYYSDQDAACEPLSIMNDVLRPLAGSPSKRLTGGGPDSLVIPITPSSQPGTVDQLELDIVTGDDNLNNSSSFNVAVTWNLGAGGIVTTTTHDANEGAEFGNNSLHAVNLKLLPDTPVADITQVEIDTNLPGGLSPDNWDISGVEVQADVVNSSTVVGGCQPQAVTLFSGTGGNRLSDHSTGLVRMMGGGPQTFTENLPAVPSADSNLLVTDLLLQVGTGADDLRGGNSPNDNVDAVLGLSGPPAADVPGGKIIFQNVNQDQNWTNFSPGGTIDLLNLNSLPPNTTASDLASIGLSTDLPGGAFPDNWDVLSLSLVAILGCQGIPPSGPQPMVESVTLADDNSRTIQDDGTSEICREKGGSGVNHDCVVNIPTPATLSPTDPVDSLSVTITTGQDDLSGGSYATSNADIGVAGVGFFPDVNNQQDWANNSVHTVDLAPWGSGITLGDLSSIDVSTNFGGGCCSDNWDIFEISVQATVTTNPSGADPRVRPVRQAGRSESMRVSPRGSGFGELSDAARRALVPTPWTVLSSDNKGTSDNVLTGVSCWSTTGCFAVGYSDEDSNSPLAFIEKWNGTKWTAYSLGVSGTQESRLNGVACLSAGDCVAIGFQGSGTIEGSAGLVQALIETWNGSAWTPAPANVQAPVSALNGVACAQKTFCTAVGYQGSSAPDQTLTEVLGAKGWSVTSSGNATRGGSVLNGVSCVSPTFCAAVGYSSGTGGSSPEQTLAEYWNGSKWSIAPTADAGGGGNVLYGMGDNVLNGVSCTGVDQCVADGMTVNNNRQTQALVEQATSKGFALSTAVEPGTGDILYGVSCASTTRCRAVGVEYQNNTSLTLNENLFGTTWFLTPPPDPATPTDFLLGVWCSTECFAVGGNGTGPGANRTMAMRFKPTVPSPPLQAHAVIHRGVATITFAASLDNGGSPITQYTVVVKNKTHPSGRHRPISGTGSPITVGHLHHGDKYVFLIVATNATGLSADSAPSNKVRA